MSHGLDRTVVENSLDLVGLAERDERILFVSRSCELVLVSVAARLVAQDACQEPLLAVVREGPAATASEEKREDVEGNLHQAQRMDAIGQLAAAIAHDVNNLLLVIRGYADVALKRVDSNHSELRGDLAEIRRASERATAVTRGLFAFAGREVPRPELRAGADVVQDLERMIIRALERTSSCLCAEAPPGRSVREVLDGRCR